MGESSSSDSWKKLVIAKTNDQWISAPSIKTECAENQIKSVDFSLANEDPADSSYTFIKTDSGCIKNYTKKTVTKNSQEDQEVFVNPECGLDPLAMDKKKKSESSVERAARLSKMSAYAARRLANETPEQRAERLQRMSQYAARRLANETSEQRAKRLARMSAYAARRLALETPEQRSARLARMSAYAARRHAMKKVLIADTKEQHSNDNNDEAVV